MRRRSWWPVGLVAVLATAACTTPAAPAGDASRLGAPAATWTVERGPELPMPIANNAVAAASVDGRPTIFSFLGLGAGRDYAAVSTRAFAFDPGAGHWESIPDVPGSTGRLAATAQAVGQRVYVLGGYEVAADGKETTSPATDIYLVAERRYQRGAAAPVPIDDTVSGVWRDRLIYLVSGWSTDRTVTTVQAYDPDADRWLTATPVPGTPVFGHAGGVVGDTIVYCGGAKMLAGGSPKYGPSAECYRGDIDPGDPARIAWRPVAAHPGAPRYRAAAGPVTTPAVTGIMFVGGTATPYNYNGIGYDGRPAEPERSSWIYDPAGDQWVAGPDLDRPTMDHRGLVHAAGSWWTVGGFDPGQTVSTRVTRLAVGGANKE